MLRGLQDIFKGAISQALEEFDNVNEEFKKTTLNEKVAVKGPDELTPPWLLGPQYVDAEEKLKQEILELSKDERTFLLPPPEGTSYVFDLNAYYSMALAALAHDEKLEKIRFEMVPKRCAETDFWRNYFYRVSMLKQHILLDIPAVQMEADDTIPTKNSETVEKVEEKSDNVVFDLEKELETETTRPSDPENVNWEEEMQQIL